MNKRFRATSNLRDAGIGGSNPLFPTNKCNNLTRIEKSGFFIFWLGGAEE
jgi:hypothetical protein